MKEIIISNEVKIIFKTLESAGFECFMVGGCVRDFLLNKTPHDIDFTTNATTNEIVKCFKNFNVIETGIKHGTVTIMINKIPYEITTYRVDGEYSDNRRPDKILFVKNISEDLARRDFTINAIAYNPIVGFVDCCSKVKIFKINGVIIFSYISRLFICYITLVKGLFK